MTDKEIQELSSEDIRMITANAADTITDKPLKIIIVRNKDYKDKTVLDRFKNWYYKTEKEREFVIYRSRVCNMRRSAAAGGRVKEVIGDVNNFYDLVKLGLPLIDNHMDDILYLVACCIQNNSKEPDKKLIKYINDNMEMDELCDLMFHSLSAIGLMSFFSCILLVKGNYANIAQGQDANNVTIQE